MIRCLQGEPGDLEEVQIVSPIPDEELLALDGSLKELERLDSGAAELVKLCFFVGLTQEQAATELDIRTALPSGSGPMHERSSSAEGAKNCRRLPEGGNRFLKGIAKPRRMDR